MIDLQVWTVFFSNPMDSPLPLVANVLNKCILFHHFVVSNVIFSQ